MSPASRHPFGTAIVLLALFLAAAPAVAAEPHPLSGPLNDRGLDNLVAFTRLLGYVRFFHPSDQAAAADWDALAIAGVQAAEPATDPEALARALEGFVRPVAPTVRVFPTGRRPDLPSELKLPLGPTPRTTAWLHHGVGLNKDALQPIFTSRRVDGRMTAPDGPGTLVQYVGASRLAGKTVRFRAAARAETGAAGEARLWLRVSTPQGDGEMNARPIPPGEWQTLEITSEVPAGAQGVSVGLLLQPEGRAWIDGAALEVVGEEGRNLLENPDFEADAPGPVPAGWMVPPGMALEGYAARSTEEKPWRGRRSAELSYTWTPPPPLPSPGDPLVVDLGGGVSAMIPLALYTGEAGTLPPVSGEAARPSPTLEPRATRLAAVALAWIVPQHFSPYLDDPAIDWPGALRRALRAAATDPDEAAFGDTLRRLMAGLRDGHGGVMGPGRPQTHRLPLSWDWMEGRLVVTRVLPEQAGRIHPGDVVAAADGRSAAEALAGAEELISGATPQWRRYRALSDLLRGPEGQEVRLDIQPREGEPFSVTLARSVTRAPELAQPRPEKIAEIRPGILYIDLDRVTDEEFEAALPRLATARGIVFDVRGYPKTTPLPLAYLTSTPLAPGPSAIPVVTRPDRDGMTFAPVSGAAVLPRTPRLAARAAFLTDGRAISYAETFLSLVERHRLGEIVGGPTAGTNGNMNPFQVPGGYQIFWTGMKVTKPDGSPHHGVGIQPTVPAARTLAGVAEGRDEVLEKGIEVVSR